MSKQEITTICQRLDRLERHNRIYKLVGITVLSLVTAVLLVGAKTDKVWDEIRARKISIIDQNGQKRAALEDIGLYLSNTKGKTMAVLGAYEGGSVLSLQGGSGNTNWSSIVINIEAEPNLSVYDNAGKRRIAMNVSDDASSIRAYDSSSVTAITGRGVMIVDNKTNKKGTLRAWLRAEDNSTGLRIWDKNQNTRLFAGVDYSDDGTSVFATYDRAGNPIWLSGSK
jgi:hypothetical protein